MYYALIFYLQNDHNAHKYYIFNLLVPIQG